METRAELQDRRQWWPANTWTLLTLALLITGCRVGPDFHPQQPAVPQGWASPTTAPASQPAIVPGDRAELARWWGEFHDPLLTSLVNRAIAANLDYRVALSVVRQARASRGVAFAALWPTVDATGSYERHFPGGVNKHGNPITGNLYQTGLDAAWEIDVFGGAQRGVEAADADIVAAVENSRNVLITLIAEVALDYISLRGTQDRIVIARNNLKAQQYTAELTKARLRTGLANALDSANAEAQVASTASVIPVFEAQVRQLVFAMSVLLGQEPAALEKELAATVPVPVASPAVPLGLPSDLLRRRPDVRNAEAQIHAATANIGVAAADLFPKFSLTGSYGYQSTNLKSILNQSSRVWGFGPSVDWQIFNAGKVFSNVELQKALTEQSALTYLKTVLTALQDVDGSMSAYAYEVEHNKALEKAVAANQKAVDLAIQIYKVGTSDFLSVLDAQRSLFVAQDAFSVSSTSLSTDLVSLYKALGGGWEESPAEGRTSPWPPLPSADDVTPKPIWAPSPGAAPAAQPARSEPRPAGAAESQPALEPASQPFWPETQPASPASRPAAIQPQPVKD